MTQPVALIYGCAQNHSTPLFGNLAHWNKSLKYLHQPKEVFQMQSDRNGNLMSISDDQLQYIRWGPAWCHTARWHHYPGSYCFQLHWNCHRETSYNNCVPNIDTGLDYISHEQWFKTWKFSFWPFFLQKQALSNMNEYHKLCKATLLTDTSGWFVCVWNTVVIWGDLRFRSLWQFQCNQKL